MKHLNHPGIPLIFDIFEDENYTYIVEQYIEGESLEALVSKRLLSEKEVFLFSIRVCLIIEYLHGVNGGILHLDIKPDNIIVADGNPFLVDFGSATYLEEQKMRVRGYSRRFAPPEQILGKSVNRSSDVYSLGKLLEFMTKNSRLRKSLRVRLRKLSRKCMEPFGARIGSAGILREMLEEMYNTETNRIRTGRSVRNSAERTVRRIGLAGLVSGVGVTHISLCFASYLADTCCKEICLVEKTGRSDYSYIGQKGTEGIVFVPGREALSEAQIRDEDYDYILYDLGLYNDATDAFLQTCDIRIIIGSAAPWHRNQYDFLSLPEREKNTAKGWYILANPANPKKSIVRCNKKILPFPAVTNPLSPSKDAIRLFEGMMK